MVRLEPLMRRNFLEYASYVVTERALPDIRDGLKPVQRRILQTLHEMDDGRFHKVANVIGETMKLHPHGDAAIGDALVSLANRSGLIDRQGNFGNPLTGHAAAAPRYIECRLSPLARETLFFDELTSFAPSYDGRKAEPVFLPVRIPLLLVLGVDGIAVGMATRVLPHNLAEVLAALIARLGGEEVRLLPDFPGGGRVDASEYDDGRGRVRLRARVERNEQRVVIHEIPYGSTTESVLASIEDAVRRKRMRVGPVRDLSTDRVEIEIEVPPNVDPGDLEERLYACTECETSLSSSIVLVRDGHPVELTVTEVLDDFNHRLIERIGAELEHEKSTIEERRHRLALERIFVQFRVYRRIEAAERDDDVRREVWDGMHAYERFFLRPMDGGDVDHLLSLPVRRISQYDLDKNERESERLTLALGECERKRTDLPGTTRRELQGRLRKLRDAHPRRSKLDGFTAVNLREVAHPDLKVSFDSGTGFFGTKARGAEHQLALSEYDRVLIICADGTYRVTAPVPRLWIEAPILHCARLPADQEASFVVVYRDPRRLAWAKRVRVPKFVKQVEGRIVPGRRTEIDLLVLEEPPGRVLLEFEPAKWRRVNEGRYNLNDLPASAPSDPGVRLSPKPVVRVARVEADARD